MGHPLRWDSRAVLRGTNIPLRWDTHLDGTVNKNKFKITLKRSKNKVSEENFRIFDQILKGPK